VEIDAAHQAVLRWCATQRRETTGERWEVYGDWHEDPCDELSEPAGDIATSGTHEGDEP